MQSEVPLYIRSSLFYIEYAFEKAFTQSFTKFRNIKLHLLQTSNPFISNL